MSFMDRSSRLARLALLLALSAGANPAAATAVFAVGTGTGCGYPTIQAAVDAAQAYPGGEDFIYISRTLTYTAQAITIGNQTVELIGGVDDCNDYVPSGKTTISGAGGATEPVFRINGGTGSRVIMRNLNISGGDEDSGGYGGGIYYRGNGVLEIVESNASNNIAGYGGGIYAEGTGTAAELIIGSNVTIAGNTARGSGGGIYVDSLRMTMTAPGSILAFNTAQGSISDGYGGGLLVNSVDYAAQADLGSNGQGTLGLVYGNTAVRGGGIAVVASNGDALMARLYLSSADLAQPARVNANFASIAGGGVYVQSKDTTFGWARGEAYVNRSYIENNQAPEGAAVNIDGNGMLAILELDGGRITGNVTIDANGHATTGGVLSGAGGTNVLLSKVAIENNRGGRLLRFIGDDYVYLRDALLAGNQTSLELVSVDGDGADVLVADSTVAGNVVGATRTITVNGDVDILRSILWQPGKTVLLHSNGGLSVTDVIANEVTSLGGGPQAIVGPPRFIDPARGDYGLRAASFAVDFAPAITGDDRDMLGLPRDQDLPIKVNFRGPRDIGALERQTLAPLVLNQDFNADLNLWPLATASSVTWDGTQNGSGSAGSGSAHVLLNDVAQARVIAASQCIHLPGPALYSLNGWGRSIGGIGTRDTVLLHWEYRINGGEACNAGTPTSQGDHIIGTSTAWTRPATPAYISVPDAQFTGTSSITVQLVVIDNSIQLPGDVNGWFDGIVLQPDSDVIFRNGFD